VESEGLCRAAEWKQRMNCPEISEEVKGLGAKTASEFLGDLFCFLAFSSESIGERILCAHDTSSCFTARFYCLLLLVFFCEALLLLLVG
jgi:hypothetical protein